MELFLHRLALAFGVLDVDALRALPVRKVIGWMAYWRVEPFGDDWRRTGRLAAIVAGSMSSNAPPDLEETFLPSYRAPQQTQEQMIEELRKIPVFAQQLAEKGL